MNITLYVYTTPIQFGFKNTLGMILHIIKYLRVGVCVGLFRSWINITFPSAVQVIKWDKLREIYPPVWNIPYNKQNQISNLLESKTIIINRRFYIPLYILLSDILLSIMWWLCICLYTQRIQRGSNDPVCGSGLFSPFLQ